MATFWISAYFDAKQTGTGIPIDKDTVAVGVEAKSKAFVATTGNSPMICRIATDTNCHYLRGEDPTADVTDEPLFAGQVEFVYLPRGHKISVIAAL